MYSPLMPIFWIVPYLLLRKLTNTQQSQSVGAVLAYWLVVIAIYVLCYSRGLPPRWGDVSPMTVAEYAFEVVFVQVFVRGPYIATLSTLLVRWRMRGMRAAWITFAAILGVSSVEVVLTFGNWTVGGWTRASTQYARVAYTLIPVAGSVAMACALLVRARPSHKG